ncbi:MAG TPA: sugar phosphate isomerase/epimerase family protein [Actinomycetota bacterium]|nr:sugar phosphate isomerase/epimerase family protein [Actinomycetota bacterium]
MSNTSTPRLACSTASVLTRSLRSTFALFADAGFTGVEIMVTKDPATQEPETILELAEEHGMRIEAIHAPFLLVTRTVWGTDPTGKILRATRLAEEVGAPIVVVHPAFRWQGGYRRWLDEELPMLERTTDVKVAVENMFPVRVRGRTVASLHASRSLEDLEGFPDVVLDTSHAAVARLDPVDAARRLAPRLRHVHLSNNAGRGWDSHLPVDEGVLELDRFLDALRTDGFGGTISLELDLRRHGDDDDALRAALTRNRAFCESNLTLRG